MNERQFSPTMSTEEFEARLKDFYRSLDENTARAFKSSMKASPRKAEGKPVSQNNLKIFQLIDERYRQGGTVTAAIRSVIEEHLAEVNSNSDNEDKIDTITRQYRRYRKVRDAGLDPSRTYDDDSFAEFILSKQFALAAAIFEVADDERVARICDKLNARIMHRVME
ncbi:hypothetical protein FG152_22755 [Ochrobactrum sp. XJ1]|nr:hypothetical protein [Ochrobactrum sp. XJ1]